MISVAASGQNGCLNFDGSASFGANKFSAKEVESHIRSKHETENLLSLKRANVLWVVGEVHASETKQDWQNMIKGLGVPDSDMIVIDL